MWRSDAIVLFDWLMNTDLHAVPITHPARKQALVDMSARLEEVDVMESTEEEIATMKLFESYRDDISERQCQ
ncbi:uncharacterized protein SAZU_8030 [Streptomyces azureus]|uniref:Uncharacterized protein n=1 Tax=Streptomyces azureus TaxID=146537 RepID=A0A0K8Q081_STRAJ|nr:uncharacterized protein SAZU_8030 [Streptomyces azureus]